MFAENKARSSVCKLESEAKMISKNLPGLLVVFLSVSNCLAQDNWPRFRGLGGHGIAGAAPTSWSDIDNIAWKLPMPGPGDSSPIVWRDRVYITCYSGYGLTADDPGDPADLARHLICIHRDNGKVIWRVEQPIGDAPMVPYSGYMPSHGYATSTPVADESGVYVAFDTSGLFAFTHDGQQRWRADVGQRTHGWGVASSPILYDDLVIYHADMEAKQLLAFKKATGEEVYRVKTPGQDSWSTPLVSTSGTRHELIFHRNGGPSTLVAADPKTGELYWQCSLEGGYLCPSPIEADGTLFVINREGAAAIRSGGGGKLTDSHVRWSLKTGSQICSPIYHQGHLYYSENDGTILCLNADTGENVFRERLNRRSRSIYASAVMAGENLHFVTRRHGVFVVAAKPSFELVAHNQFESDDSTFNGTPAVANGQIYIRSNKFLYCIGTTHRG